MLPLHGVTQALEIIKRDFQVSMCGENWRVEEVHENGCVWTETGSPALMLDV